MSSKRSPYLSLRVLVALFTLVSGFPSIIRISGLIYRPVTDPDVWYSWMFFKSYDYALATAFAIFSILTTLILGLVILHPSKVTTRLAFIFAVIMLALNASYIIGAHPHDALGMVPHAVVLAFLSSLSLMLLNSQGQPKRSKDVKTAGIGNS